MSGARCRDILADLLDGDRWRRGVFPVRIVLPDNRALPALALIFPAPRSFTGEDTVELAVPGNPHLCRRLLARLADLGARGAEPGEFTARAFLNGRLSVEQAEGVGLAIAARSAEQLDAAERLISGETGAEYRRMTDDLAQALALVEAGIDFTDEEDVVAISPDDLIERLDGLCARVESILAGAAGGETPSAEPVVVLAGAPNAGKSTLFNALLGRMRSVVSDEPGTTRDAIAERLDLSAEFPGADVGVTLVDPAGLDAALSQRGDVDRASQEAARTQLARADLVIVCDPEGRFDSPGAIPPDSVTLRVRTKADLPSSTGIAGDGESLGVCALDGWNLGALRRAIADAARQARGGGELTLLPRHHRALDEALRELRQARERVAGDAARRALSEPEVAASSLRRGLDALGAIAGRVPPDDVIGRIFATFCIGK